ncbi:MAG: PorV/PorQ family protein [Spirochaetia bacterium]|nr:PorV/PorQ family protein [Spirochaetia bacterium]
MKFNKPPSLHFALASGAAAVLFFLCGNVFAAGTVTGDFLLVNVSARETALGEIYAPFYAKPSAAIINPATMQGIKQKYIFFSHFNSVFNSRFEQVEYAMPVGVSACAGAYFMFSTNDSLYRTDEFGAQVEKIDNYKSFFGAGYSIAFSDEFNFGLSLKVISSKVISEAEWGAAVNAGMLYRNYERKYTLGVDIENLGLSTAFFEDKSLYPIVLRGGYGMEIYRYENEYRITLYIEEKFYVNESQGAETSFGMEAVYKKFFTFRYGYIFGRSEGRVSAGIGVRLNDLHIDYAYQPFFISDNAHKFTVKYIF